MDKSPPLPKNIIKSKYLIKKEKKERKRVKKDIEQIALAKLEKRKRVLMGLEKPGPVKNIPRHTLEQRQRVKDEIERKMFEKLSKNKKLI